MANMPNKFVELFVFILFHHIGLFIWYKFVICQIVLSINLGVFIKRKSNIFPIFLSLSALTSIICLQKLCNFVINFKFKHFMVNSVIIFYLSHTHLKNQKCLHFNFIIDKILYISNYDTFFVIF